MSSFTIAFTLAFDLVLLISFIVIFLKKRTKNPEAKKDDPPNSLNRVKKQDSKVQEKDYGQSNEIIADNSGWKEENLDGF